MRRYIELIILVCICALPFGSMAQERVNPEIPAKISKTIGELRNATGWNFNIEQKKWVSGQNKIPYKDWARKEYRDLGMDNFNLFKFVELTYKGKPYYMLMKQFTGGDYKYRSINKGWYTYDEYWYAVFTKKEYEKLKKLEDRTPILLKIYVVEESNQEFGPLDYKKIETKIDIDNYVKTWGNNIYFHFYIYTMKDKGLVQFYIYNYVEDIRKRKNKPYYEISLKKFNGLFGLGD